MAVALGGIERDVARLLACYDPRTEISDIAEQLEVSENYVRTTIRKLRERGYELWPQHIRDIRPLGLLVAVVYTKTLMGDAASLSDLEQLGVPAYRYLHSYRATLDNLHVYSYFLPREFLDELIAEVERGLGGEVEVGVTIPVRYDCNRYRDGIGTASLHEEIRQAIAVLEEGAPSLRLNLLDLMIYAGLDLNPLAGIRELQDPGPVYAERLEMKNPGHRLSYRRLVSRYRQLGSKRLVGRVLLLAATIGSDKPIPLFIRVRRECFPVLYALALATWSTPGIFVGEETAATVLVLPDEATDYARELLRDCILYAGVVTRGFGTTIPVEMYDPLEGRWVLEPQPLPDLLRRLGYLAS